MKMTDISEMECLFFYAKFLSTDKHDFLIYDGYIENQIVGNKKCKIPRKEKARFSMAKYNHEGEILPTS